MPETLCKCGRNLYKAETPRYEPEQFGCAGCFKSPELCTCSALPMDCPICKANRAGGDKRLHSLSEFVRFHPESKPDCPSCWAFTRHTPETWRQYHPEAGSGKSRGHGTGKPTA